MSREEYMRELAYLLQDIPDGEREEALSWYEDYFDEAGEGEEAEVIRKLGSPAKVAALIKDGLNGGNDEAGEYTETGYQDSRFREDNKVPEPRMEPLNEEKDTDYKYGRSGIKRKRSRGEYLLILILCIVAVPVILPLAGSVFGILAGILGVGLAVAVAVPVCVVVAVILGIVLVGVGIVEVFLSPGFGFLMLGGGCLALAAGILLILACILVFGKFRPWAFRSVAGFLGKTFQRGGYDS